MPHKSCYKSSRIKKISLFLLFLTLFNYFIIPASAFALTEHTYFIHTDHLGSVIAVSDENGNNTLQEKYSPYGNNPITGVTNNPIERKYTGQIKDKNTTLYYYNARYYDPVLSRFISADSV